MLTSDEVSIFFCLLRIVLFVAERVIYLHDNILYGLSSGQNVIQLLCLNFHACIFGVLNLKIQQND